MNRDIFFVHLYTSRVKIYQEVPHLKNLRKSVVGAVPYSGGRKDENIRTDITICKRKHW